ncbi:MAG: MOSC domain-containing protein [Betaproteobacteria bacterium]
MMRVAALFAYPVKSCGAVPLDSAVVDGLGLEADRRFAFVDRSGRALTQRDQPLLATVRAALGANALHLDLGGLAQVQAGLRDFTAATEVDVWGKRVPGNAAPANDVITDYLGAAIRLVRLEASAPRAFTDSQPVLVTTTWMLARLNAALARPVEMERFRPNVVVEGDVEDWRELQAEEVMLERIAPCERCEVVGPEALREVQRAFGGNFGLYWRVARPGRLRVGEALEAR